MLDPFFSIITPVKNGSKFINKYIYSLKSQLFTNWEAIIIDDLSNDNTLELLKSETIEDKRFKIKRIKNKNQLTNGPYYARNLGIEASSGKYICFLDIDDFWFPQKLERQYKVIKNNNKIKLLYSNYLRFRESNKVFTMREQHLKRFNIKNLIKIYNPIPNLTSCVKREIIGNSRFSPINHEDYLFWQQIIKKLSKSEIYYDNDISSIYTIHPKSISSSKIVAILWIIIVYKKFGYRNIRLIINLFLRAILQIYILLKEFNSLSKLNNKLTKLAKTYQEIGYKLIPENELNYDFLGSMYFNTKAKELEISLQSIKDQTLSPKNVILVCDGKIKSECDQIIRKYKKLIPLKILKLKKNNGLGQALREGIKLCESKYVLRFDTDDFNVSCRAERQLKYAIMNDFDILGSYVYEYIDNPKNINAIKKVPLNQKDINMMIYFRNPFNHPSICFKRDSILNLDGGYRNIKYAEDYDLWIRSYFSNLRVGNINEILVGMNSIMQIERRLGNLLQKEFSLLKTFYSCSNISIFIALPTFLIRIIIHILPTPLLKYFYKNILRSSTYFDK